MYLLGLGCESIGRMLIYHAWYHDSNPSTALKKIIKYRFWTSEKMDNEIQCGLEQYHKPIRQL
jgi:hypothetical protein